MTAPMKTVCPWCSARHDDAMIIDAASWQPPKVGDVSLCITCAQPGIWTAYGLRLPTPAESTLPGALEHEPPARQPTDRSCSGGPRVGTHGSHSHDGASGPRAGRLARRGRGRARLRRTTR